MDWKIIEDLQKRLAELEKRVAKLEPNSDANKRPEVRKTAQETQRAGWKF